MKHQFKLSTFLRAYWSQDVENKDGIVQKNMQKILEFVRMWMQFNNQGFPD